MPTKRFEKLNPERRRKILAVARTEFSRKGFDGASLNSIIQEAEISKGSLYYYFEDKEDLYITVLMDAIAEIAQKIGGITVEDKSTDFWGDFRDFYIKMLELGFTNPELVKLVSGIFRLSGSRYGDGPVAEFYRKGKEYTIEVLERGQEIGAVRKDIPMDLLVDIIFSMGEAMDHWTLEHWEELSKKKTKKIANKFVNIYKRVVEA